MSDGFAFVLGLGRELTCLGDQRNSQEANGKDLWILIPPGSGPLIP